jgi:membrane fusion protein, heavy metal efflux system
MSNDLQNNPEATDGRGRGWSTRRQISVLALAAGLLLVAIAVFWLLSHNYGGDKAASASEPPPGTFKPTAQQLKTLTIEPVALRQFVSEERTEGKIAVNGDRETPVFSPYSGRITKILANLGDVVSPGQTLATIEASEFSQAQTDLRSASALVKLARTSETRKHALYDIKGGSLADWQQAQADLAAAESNFSSVRNRLQILGYTGVQIDQISSAEHFDPSANILAPLRGIIVDRQVGPGQFAQSGASNPLFTIADLSSVWMVANVREADAGRVHRGQSVEVRVLAYPDRVFSAHVVYVAPVVDPGTHRLTVRAVIDNADGALKPEMFADFRILTSTDAQSPGVPQSAVVYEGDSAHVWVVQSDDAIVVRPIQVGRTNDGFVEVLDGLRAGERVVTHGGLFIDRAAATG